MAKLRQLTAREVVAILERHDFSAVRRKGSHIVMQRVTDEGTVTAIVPDHRPLKPGTLASVIRQSRLPRSEFE